MDASKGIAVIIRAYADLATELGTLPPLWLVGGIPAEVERLREDLGELLVPLEARKLITWWGFQRPAVISGLLTRSLALLMHSQYEPGGRVVVEALAAGLPVIATPNGFARELVRDWVSGFVVPYGDVKLLRTRMAHFIRQPLLRNALGLRSRAIALNALSEWRFVDAHCEVYDSAAMQSSGAGTRLVPTPMAATGDVLRERTITPTYAASRPPADDVLVDKFVRRHRSTIRIEQRQSPQVALWTATEGDDQWIIKQVDARLAVRPLWDPEDGCELLRRADDRFAGEVFSSALSPFVPLTSSSAEHSLIMRPAGTAVALTPESLPAFGQVLVTLGRSEAPASDCYRPPAALTPEQRWRRVSSMLQQRLVAPPEPGDLTAAKRFAEAARSQSIPIRLAHGNPEPAHFVRQAGQLKLISGGNLEYAAFGKDLALLLLHTVERFGIAIAKTVLRDCDPAEAEAVWTWARVLALEGVCRNTLLCRPARVRIYRDSWSLLRDRASAVTR
jgi:hypothetical protein